MPDWLRSMIALYPTNINIQIVFNEFPVLLAMTRPQLPASELGAASQKRLSGGRYITSTTA